MRQGASIWLLATLIIGLLTRGTVAGDAYEEPEVSEFDRQHWSFQQLQRPPVPSVPSAVTLYNAIDRFVLAQLLDKTGLDLAKHAPRVKLIRRAYYDLLGLPPSPADVSRFLSDRRPDAYERLIDRLLASPDYGARWAQFWLDLARFAETDGFEHDKVRDQAWRYRDWVIEALNADMPYDQFVQWQIAGDVLAPNDSRAKVATAFCLSGPDMPDINLQEERKHVLLNEMASTVGSTFLGLQVGCAQCHDHMYDPVSQADFYRLRAFFRSGVHVERNKSVGLLREDTKAVSQPARLMIRGDFRRPGPVVEPAFLRVLATNAGSDRPLSRSDLAIWLTRKDHPLTARVMANRLWQFHFGRGLSDTPSDFGVMGSEPSHPKLLDWLATELVAGGWQLKRLHRLILTSATYRQIGEQPPSEMEQKRWNQAIGSDADNIWLSRFPRRRLEAEVIRDAMYAVSDTLNDEMRGPGVRPPLPRELLSTLLRNQWNPTPEKADHYRRSVYIFARRNLRFPMLAMFDRPSANNSCACRQTSTTSPQSLLMLNSAATLDAAQRLAGIVFREVGSDSKHQVRRAIIRAFGRESTHEEERVLLKFLNQQTATIERSGQSPRALPIPAPATDDVSADRAAALTDLCLALLNSNEFVYLD